MTTEIANVNTADMIFNSQSMELLDTLAATMSMGIATIPKHLQKNKSDCMAVAMQAMQWGMNPYAVAQKTHLINGTLGYEAQLINAVISSSRAIKGRFHYRYGGNWDNTGDGKAVKIEAGVNVNMGVTIDTTCWVQVGAVLAGEDEITWGEPLYPSAVTTRNSPLWKTAPKQQSAYLALKYWARLYSPAVVMGVYSPDEFEDYTPSERVVNPAPASTAPVEGSTKSSKLNSILNRKLTVIENEPEVVPEQSGSAADEDGVISEVTADFANRIGHARSLAELEKVGALIKGAVDGNVLIAMERDLLYSTFGERKHQLKAEFAKSNEDNQA